MLSIKHFIQLVIIIIVFSAMFLYLNISNRITISENIHNNSLILPELEEELEKEKELEKKENLEVSYYVIFSGGDEIEEAIYKNICLFLEEMKLPYETKAFVSEGELASGITLLFCNMIVSEGIDVKVLGRYIKQGGKALFASGIPEGFAETYLSPIWGIIEKGNRTESRHWKIYEGVMPASEQEVIYPEFQASTKVKINQDAKILIEDVENKIPIMYQFNYGNGSSLMINGTFMQNRDSGGIFTAAIAALQEEIIYPVIGTKSIFLDNFPFILPGYDKNCMALYGRSAESFERDVLWPTLLSYITSYNIRYTMNLWEPEKPYDSELLNGKLLNLLVKENLRYSGEIMISKTDRENETVSIQQLLRQYLPNYEVQAFSILTESKNDIQNKNFSTNKEEKIKNVLIERKNYQENEKNQEEQLFDFKEGNISFPVMSSGFVKEDCMYQYLSGVTLYGAASHSLPVGQFITSSSYEESYESKKKEMIKTLNMLGTEAKWLENVSITEAANRVLGYRQLNFKFVINENQLIGYCKRFSPKQKFIFRTDRKIETISGAVVSKINNYYYCIEALEEEFHIILKQ